MPRVRIRTQNHATLIDIKLTRTRKPACQIRNPLFEPYGPFPSVDNFPVFGSIGYIGSPEERRRVRST